MNIISVGMRLLGRLKYAPHFEKITKDPLGTQTKLLLDLIAQNQDTVYGREHKFDKIKTISDYQKNVPINKYLDLLPYVEREKNGEEAILTKEKPLLFALTSGTTGKPKYIPLTPTFIRKYQEVAQIWFYFLIKDHPEYFDGKIFMPGSSFAERYTKGGVPVGTISSYIMGHLPYVIRRKYVFSDEDIKGCEDYEAKYYVMMRLAMEQQVSGITLANPAIIILLAQKGNEHRNEIIKDIKGGTLSKKFNISQDSRKRIEAYLGPNLKRAAELESIAKEKGVLYPKDYWPRIACVCVWKGGSLSAYLPQLPKYLGSVPIRGAGFSATEGRFCTPISDKGTSGVLAVDTLFYEFIPEENRHKEKPRLLTVDQLEKGKNYYLIATTHSGLYRYDINDVIRVTGWYNNTPLIEFLRKGEGFSSIVGEKLSEWQVLRALKAARKDIKLPFEFALVKAEQGAPAYYKIYASFKRKLSPSEQNEFLAVVDNSLRKFNIEYEKRRASLRLGSPKLKEIDGDKVNTVYHNYRLARGAYEAQIKCPCLIADYNLNDFNFLKEAGVL
jgi:hypothetical protein